MQKLQAIVLAAGKSIRFKTGKSKLLERICGQEMITYPIKVLSQLNIDITTVVGYEKEKIQEILQTASNTYIQFITQEKQLGTGHALKCTKQLWNKEYILVLNGDIPLITKDIIKKLYDKHIETKAAISFVIAHNPDPSMKSYGRIVKTQNTIQIVEARHFSGDTHEHCCINAGIYIISKDFLLKSIDDIEENRSVKEFYLTDLIKIASDHNKTISTLSAPFDRIRGVNTHEELWAVEQIQRSDLVRYWMERGVRFSVAQNVHVDLDITIGSGTYIGCGIHLLKGTTIGSNCIVEEFTSLESVILGNNVRVKPFCVIKNSIIENDTVVGPFAHIKENTTIGQASIIGNFVEVTRSTIGANTKAKHLTYIGDATIGNNVNIGAGTIFAIITVQLKTKPLLKMAHILAAIIHY